ncbi:cytochrome [Sesamum angolense]|uniref:Cytochrome n=1 Tax=Sesamum angolense TaxID=2727404 RepID=A0AAE2BWC7_9LAMI|nr:cytochrome [Sesamum angolense]
MEGLDMVVSCMALGLLFCFFVLKWNEFRYSRKGVPPGTMGWPFFGQTSDFLTLGPQFMRNQKARYGSVFKTHILGSPMVISTDPELNRYILLNEAKGLVPGYPQSMVDILGSRNIAAVHGSTHRHIRNNLLSLVGTPVVKDRLLSRLDKHMRLFLSDWDGKTIDIQQKTKEMAFAMAFKQIAEVESSSIYDSFKREFDKFLIGTLSLPVNIPGTNYHLGIKSRRNVVKTLTELMEKRRGATAVTYDDMLAHLIRDGTTRYGLTDDGYHIVVFETLRLATVINGVLRKTTKDVQLNGFTIPKGWRIYVYLREINYDPLLYPEPLKFNPWRWLQDEKLEANNYVLLFGGGTRLCPGKELGIVKVATFLHYLATTYRWEEIGGEKMLKFPRVKATNGYHVNVMKI